MRGPMCSNQQGARRCGRAGISAGVVHRSLTRRCCWRRGVGKRPARYARRPQLFRTPQQSAAALDSDRMILKSRLARIVVMSAYLVAIGVMVGGALGVATFAAGMISDGESLRVLLYPWTYILGGGVGAVIGAVLAPVMAWIFLRRVPLWRAIAEPALGTLLGILVAAATVPWGTVLFPLIGFLAGAIRLWFVDGRRRQVHGSAV